LNDSGKKKYFQRERKNGQKRKRKPKKWRTGLMCKAVPRNQGQKLKRVILQMLKESGTLAWPCIFIEAGFAGSPVNLAFLFDFDPNDNVLKSRENLQNN
jgi:hypothetical protein